MPLTAGENYAGPCPRELDLSDKSLQQKMALGRLCKLEWPCQGTLDFVVFALRHVASLWCERTLQTGLPPTMSIIGLQRTFARMSFHAGIDNRSGNVVGIRFQRLRGLIRIRFDCFKRHKV